MKSMLIAVVGAAALMVAGTAGAQEDLAKSSGCLNCHAVDTKKVGPSFKDIAAKHKDDKNAEATLVAKIKSGKGHPKAAGSDEELGAAVKEILSTK